ncbi:hypothetical protein Metal_2324 [Methylomicrobium album BG8]|uniref:Uncharacterized protein n=1 Tax=Methylomicrobium album BG8 TaxID=686340 RepID=H8GGU7_METAL|nr:hypothetical protein Metal_2324 [Methylomicrobium album BG8]
MPADRHWQPKVLLKICLYPSLLSRRKNNLAHAFAIEPTVEKVGAAARCPNLRGYAHLTEPFLENPILHSGGDYFENVLIYNTNCQICFSVNSFLWPRMAV